MSDAPQAPADRVEADPPLTASQFSSLLEVACGGTMQREIPPDHAAVLFSLEYVDSPEGLPAITARGKTRAEMGK
jgi:hypothetical protein